MKRQSESEQKAKRQKETICSCPEGGKAEYGTYEIPFTHCVKCKQPDMTLKKNGKHHCQCNPPRKVFYGHPGGRPTRCGTCKAPGMEVVVKRLCKCGVQPIYGLPGGKPTHCTTCKDNGMVDLVHVHCLCGKRASFGEKGGPLTHCSKCKVEGAEDLTHARCACGVQANFGFLGGKPTHCAKCKLEDMEDVGNARCVSCRESLAKTDGYCLRCHPDYVQATNGISKIGCQWIDELERELDHPIKHGHYHDGKLEGKEFRPPCMTRRPVDGYLKVDTLEIKRIIKMINPLVDDTVFGEKGLVLEMLGDIWHGHKDLWPQVKNYKGLEYRSLYKDTKEKMKLLTTDGYIVIYIWESEYKQHKKNAGDLYSSCRVFDGRSLC